MPVRRRNAKTRAHRITAEAIEAFERADYVALHLALGLGPWVPSPLEVAPGEPSPWPPGSGGHEHWPLAQQLRAELLAAGAKLCR